MIIAVTGGIGAGESTFTELLEKRGFQKISHSDILRDILREQGKPVTRENLRALGDELRKKYGGDAVSRLVWKKIQGKGNWVIDSLYTTEEARFLRSKGSVIVGITADAKTRYERVKKRGDRFRSFKEFLEADKHDRESGIDQILQDADFIISNDGTLEELEQAIDSLISYLSQS